MIQTCRYVNSLSPNKRWYREIIRPFRNCEKGFFVPKRSNEMTKQTIVLIQMDIVFGQPKENYQHVIELFEQADLQEDEIVVLPEMWNTAYDLTHLAQIADPDSQQTVRVLSALAQKYQVTIFGGSVAVKENKQFFNRSYVISKQGTVIAQYDKVHLFGLMHEEQYLTAGAKRAEYHDGLFQFAPVICYDLRFPEWFRVQAQMGINTFILAAQWPKPRIQQWKQLAIARAIENQCYIVAVNRVGFDPENEYNGHSLVIAPTGEILKELGTKEEIVRSVIELEQIQTTRNNMSVLADTRPDLYENIRKGENHDAN